MTTTGTRLHDVADALARALDGLVNRGTVAVYLFGSHADDRAHRESDIDVGVLFDRAVYPTARARFEARLDFAAVLARALGTDQIDIVVLNDAPPMLGRRIVTTGRRLYCGDDAATHAFVRDVQLRAADLAPFLRRTRRTKLDALGG
jgi:predicted nucleotidyltransferase